MVSGLSGDFVAAQGRAASPAETTPVECETPAARITERGASIGEEPAEFVSFGTDAGAGEVLSTADVAIPQGAPAAAAANDLFVFETVAETARLAPSAWEGGASGSIGSRTLGDAFVGSDVAGFDPSSWTALGAPQAFELLI